MSVRVRFAPSPTGYVHIGGLRTALYNYLFAKQQGGEYILRIEDTDRSRYVEGAIEGMLSAMDWSGVVHSEGPFLENGEIVQKGEKGPYIQSQRLDIYKDYIDRLLESDNAYYCFCSKERLEEVRETQKANGETPRYDGKCRNISLEEARKKVAAGESNVVRMKLPENHDVVFEDLVRGKVTVNTSELDDQVLVKTDGYPTYHFAVIVDDHWMGITHIIRGQEWLPSTPKHVLLYEAFGWEAPKYVHLPNILNSDKKKLSKRQGDVAVEDFCKKGYLPEALVNYVALLGWSPEDNEEIMNMDELIKKFSLQRVSKSGGVFDVNKLNWVNSHYIKEKSVEDLVELCLPYLIEAEYLKESEIEEKNDWVTRIVRMAQERISYLSQIVDFTKLFIGETVELENEEVAEMLKGETVVQALESFKAQIASVEVVDGDFAKSVFKAVQKETGIKGKNLFMPIRAAISGELHGPDMGDILVVLGKDTIINRIEFVLKKYC